ncbi:serine 3-dehydrogenase [Biscogniauxia sp. FL1348]|nr:serine 3-dehydrogenase [Biscogniauxia sp. FL1348]
MSGSSDKKVWLITGCSSGLGLEIASAALDRGDTVVATARDPRKLNDLAGRGAITERLDVTASESSLAATVASITARTGGRIDILVNNAGYILTGGVEECSREEVQATFETNVFGQLNVLRAVLPVMRRQRAGVVANMGSIGGWHGTTGAGLYCATKASAAILAEALRGEVAHLGIQVTALEPGYTRTNFLVPGHRLRAAKVLDDIKEGVDPVIDGLAAYSLHQPNDPAKVAKLIVEALTGTGRCEGRTLPPRMLIGEDAYKIVGGDIDEHRENWGLWEDLATKTNHDE